MQSKEVQSSNHMEKEGLPRALEFLISNSLPVKMLITDRHQWRIQHFKKGGSTTTQMHSQALPDIAGHSNFHNAPYK